MSKLKPQKINKVESGDLPEVSIVMAVKNGKKVIRRRISNFLNLDYPEGKLEIIVVSDGSTDDTNQILDDIKIEFSENKTILKVVSYFPSKGNKSNAATSEITPSGRIRMSSQIEPAINDQQRPGRK